MGLEKIYDCVVIGAGPSGLMAGRELQSSGLDYLIIDRKGQIGLPRKCAEGINAEHFMSIFGRERYDFIENVVHRHTVVCRDTRRTFDADFFQLDRPRFEQWLARGLTIELQNPCTDLKICDDFVEITCEKKSFRARLAVLGYGCCFWLQKRLGIITDDPVIAIGYGGIYEDYDLDPSAFHYFFDHESCGYLWVFPKSDRLANIGCAYFSDRKSPHKNIKAVLKGLLERHGLAPRQVSEYAGTIPCSGPIRRTYADRVIICGDAAGQVFAGTGEGIRYALLSGTFAGRVAADAIREGRSDTRYLRRYEEMWKKAFGGCMAAGVMFREVSLLAAKHNKVERFYQRATDSELKDFLLRGVVPPRARMLAPLIKVDHLLSSRA